jgi:hypothetical protein
VSLPVTGDPGLPILPLILIGAGAIGSGLVLGRSRSQRR